MKVRKMPSHWAAAHGAMSEKAAERRPVESAINHIAVQHTGLLAISKQGLSRG